MSDENYLLSMAEIRTSVDRVWLMLVIGPSGKDVSRLCEVSQEELHRRTRFRENPKAEVEEYEELFFDWEYFGKMRRDFSEAKSVEGFRVFVRLLDRDPEEVYPFLYE
jgi:hypothetical protein